jgi:hypothetical protein
VEQRADCFKVIYDMDYPYGGPENEEQHMREHERYLFSLHALARVHYMARVMAVIEANTTLWNMVQTGLQAKRGLNLNDLGHFQHLRYECGISDRQFEHFLTKKEAA